MHPVKIHQFVHTLAFGDAISGEALTIQRVLAAAGIGGDIVVVHRDQRYVKQTTLYADFKQDPESALLLHYSIASPLNQLFCECHGMKRAMIYHNLTPERWYLPYNGRVVADLHRAREGLKSVVECCDLVLGDSAYNLQELSGYRMKEERVFPLTVDSAKWSIEANSGIRATLKGHGGVNFLTVGRIAPNKCLEDILKCFYFYHHKINRKSRLWIVGSDVDTELYKIELHDLIDHLCLREAVTMTGAVSDTELKAFYESADMYLCMSEHEGFCVPLIEAMFFELPVIAYDSCAVAETLGRSGVLVQKKEHAKIAELMHICLSEPAVRDKMMQFSREELQRFSLESFQEQLIRDLVEPLRALRAAELPAHAQSWA